MIHAVRTINELQEALNLAALGDSIRIAFGDVLSGGITRQQKDDAAIAARNAPATSHSVTMW